MDIHEQLTGIIQKHNKYSKVEKCRDTAYEILNEFALLNKGEAQDTISRIRSLEDALMKTRALVCEGAEEGFNCHSGDWVDRLYRNNGDITRALNRHALKHLRRH